MQAREMEPIIPPVDRELLRAELTPERKARDTKKAGNEIYIFPASECPALMREIGRLREIAFRGAGSYLRFHQSEVCAVSMPKTWPRTGITS